MESFYASVETACNPSLRGKPVAVCGDPALRHGIVLAASREAKAFGVKTGQPAWECKRLCPEHAPQTYDPTALAPSCLARRCPRY